MNKTTDRVMVISGGTTEPLVGKAFSVLDYPEVKKAVDVATHDPRDLFAAFALLGLMISGEPEDAKHNAIVAYKNADEMMRLRKAYL